MKSIEHEFIFPELTPVKEDIASALQGILDGDLSDEAKKVAVDDIRFGRFRLSYETQDMPYKTFRSNGKWHIDDPWAHTVSFFATSTTASVAACNVEIFDTIEPIVKNGEDTNDYVLKMDRTSVCLAIIAISELFDSNWLEVAGGLSGSEAEREKINEFVTVQDLEIATIPEFTIATGGIDSTLHKSMPRLPDAPRARIFGREQQFR